MSAKQASMVKYTKRRAKLAQYHGFADELTKIALGYQQNLGIPILQTGRGVLNRAAGWIGQKAVQAGKDLASAPMRTFKATGESLIHPAKTFKQGWKATWNPAVKGKGEAFTNKAFFLAGTGMQGATAIAKNDPTGRDESRLTRGMRAGVGAATGIMGMKRGVLPSIALGIAGDVAGGAAGRRIDKARGYVPKPKKTAPDPMMPQRVAGPVAAVPQVAGIQQGA
jgi:hypothetical protein